MKTILLDFDGVMVKNQPWKKVDLHEDGFYKFDLFSIENLKRIISETQSTITLTTSHKDKYSLKEWEEIFHRRGLDVVIFKVSKFDKRIDEITNWYQNNKNIDFVILDDDKTLNDLPPNIKDRLVLTESGIGLNLEKTEMVIKIFKN
jgi:hypothetical protein